MRYFTQDAVQFFIDLKQNNDREWFAENKARYLNAIQQPAMALVTDLGKQLQTILPDIAYGTQTNGSGSIMRIHRDVRFSHDKSPYKSWQGIRLWEGMDHNHCPSRFFFYINETGGGVYVGNYGFNREELLAYQQAVNHPLHGDALAALVKKLSERYEVGAEGYKNVPRGYPKDHPHAPLLKFKSLYAHSDTLSPEDIAGDQLCERIFEHFKTLNPLHQWLSAVL